MKQFYLEVMAAGGITLQTGSSLRDNLLGVTPLPSSNYLVVSKLTPDQIRHILVKLEVRISKVEPALIIADNLIIRVVQSLQELNDPTDFKINNIYYNPLTETFFDPFSGLAEIKNKTLSAPKQVFLESPIKMVEACRLVGMHNFTFEVGTWFDIYDNARIIKHVTPEAIRHELELILLTPYPSTIFKQLQETRVLEYILPELAACETIIQSRRAGVTNVFEHVMYALDACPPILELRLAILFHDIAKPQTMECAIDGTIHFFKHEVLGSKIAKTYLKYWGFPKELVNSVPHLVLHHMFDADPRMTDKTIKRLIRKVGQEHIFKLLRVREADRQGTPEKISLRKIKVLEKRIKSIIDGYNNSSITNSSGNNPVTIQGQPEVKSTESTSPKS